MNKLAAAVASGLLALASSGADARVILSQVNSLMSRTGIAAGSLLGDIPDQTWVIANGAKTMSACAPYQAGRVFTSDAAALAALLDMPEEFRPELVRFTRLTELALIASRTTVLSAPSSEDLEAFLPDSGRSNAWAVLGEQVFGRELTSTLSIAY